MTPEQQRAVAVAQARAAADQAGAPATHDPLGDFMHLLGFPGGQGAAAAVRGAADTGLVGFGDEGAAALAIDPFQGDYGTQYEANLKRIRDEQAAAQRQYPAEYLGGQVAGGIASAAATPEIAPLRALGLGGRIVEGAATGAGYGAAYGAGSADGSLADRGAGAATGGAIGAGAGTLGTLAMEGLVGLARGVGQPIISTIRGAFNPEAEAARRVAIMQARDARVPQPTITPQDEATAAINQQPVMNIDRGGAATRALAQSAANTSPEARAVLDRAITDRYEAQGQRTADAVRQIVGGGTTADTRDQLVAQAAAANRPAYMRAFNDPGAQGMWDEGLQQLAGAPVVQDAIRQATITGRNEAALGGFPPIRNPFTTDPAMGRLTLAVDDQGNRILPNLQFWDQVKRNLDRVGTREAQQAARVLRDHLDQLVPAYGAARSGAAQAFGARDALEAGDAFVTSRMGNDEARRALAQMSAAERELFAEGFADSLVRRVQEVRDRQNVVTSIFGSQAARDRVRIALGSDRADQLEAFLRVEGLLDNARGAVRGYSTTLRQFTEAGLAGGLGFAVSGGNVTDPKFLMTAALVRGARAGGRAIDVGVAQRIAEMLTSQDPAVIQRGLQVVTRSNILFDALRRAGLPAGVVGTEAGVRQVGPRPQPATVQ